MTENQAKEKFLDLVYKLRNKIIIRIIEPRQEYATIHVFTALTLTKRTLVKTAQKERIAWLQYECRTFEANIRVSQKDCFRIRFLEEKDFRTDAVTGYIEKSLDDIAATSIDIDGTEQTTHNALALFYYTHLARLQGMIVGQSQFYTDFDRVPFLVVADRIGAVVKSKMFEMHQSFELIKKL